MLKKVDLEEEKERDCCWCEVLGLGACAQGRERVADEIAISIRIDKFLFYFIFYLEKGCTSATVLSVLKEYPKVW